MSALARYIVDAVVLERRSPTELARDHGITRRWIHSVMSPGVGDREISAPN
jgi:hypothetical protein